MGLTAQGYAILEAPNGKAALALLSQTPDLVILDLGLPDIQGHELLRMTAAMRPVRSKRLISGPTTM
jgi:two-component system KDP operon response regulator KdpE